MPHGNVQLGEVFEHVNLMDKRVHRVEEIVSDQGKQLTAMDARQMSDSQVLKNVSRKLDAINSNQGIKPAFLLGAIVAVVTVLGAIGTIGLQAITPIKEALVVEIQDRKNQEQRHIDTLEKMYGRLIDVMEGHAITSSGLKSHIAQDQERHDREDVERRRNTDRIDAMAKDYVPRNEHVKWWDLIVQNQRDIAYIRGLREGTRTAPK